MSTPIYAVMIRRDAYTTTPANVPAYEVPILLAVFGEENVLNAEGKLIGDAGLGQPSGTFAASDDEYDRLARRYQGNDKGSYVEQVYGLKSSDKLKDAIASATKPKKAKE